MFTIIKPLFYNGKKKIDTKCHTKHLGIYDWIYIHLKHIRLCEMKKKPLEYLRNDTQLIPLQHLVKIQNMGNKMEKCN